MRKINFLSMAVIMASVALMTGCTTSQVNKATYPSKSEQRGTQVGVPQKHQTTEELAFEWRDNLLKEMSNPSQGEDCINDTCTETATLYSEPSVSKANVTLNMASMKYYGWYILIAPTMRDALHVAQELIHRPLHLPYDAGVMIVRQKTIDYYWVDHGKEFGKSVKEHA